MFKGRVFVELYILYLGLPFRCLKDTAKHTSDLKVMLIKSYQIKSKNNIHNSWTKVEDQEKFKACSMFNH